MISVVAGSRAKTSLLALVMAALLALVVGCTSHGEPELPANTDTAGIADRTTGPDGQTFLREITTASWNDDGQRAAELFAWIPRDAQSTDRSAATRAGRTAHAIASFIADEKDSIAGAPANPALWQAYAQSLVPYLGAFVGDESGVTGFAPLDGLNSQMRRTAAVFAAMARNSDANRIFADAASQRARTFEAAFAKAAVAEPASADRGEAQRNLLQAARLRSLVATGAYLADPKSDKPAVAYAQTELAYQVASLTARPGDLHIDPNYFGNNGRLLSQSEIPDDSWSLYDSQLTVYLAPWPAINDAIRQFGRAYGVIASGQ